MIYLQERKRTSLAASAHKAKAQWSASLKKDCSRLSDPTFACSRASLKTQLLARVRFGVELLAPVPALRRVPWARRAIRHRRRAKLCREAKNRYFPWKTLKGLTHLLTCLRSQSADESYAFRAAEVAPAPDASWPPSLLSRSCGAAAADR